MLINKLGSALLGDVSLCQVLCFSSQITMHTHFFVASTPSKD